MISGVGPYSALITPKAGSLLHAVFQSAAHRVVWKTRGSVCHGEAEITGGVR